MTNNIVLIPQIYYPTWLTQAHKLLGPTAQKQLSVELDRSQVARNPSRRDASWVLGQKTTHNVLAMAFRSSDAVFGNASNSGRGLLGHLAHGVSSCASAVLTSGSWLSLDVAASKHIFKCVSQTLLLPLGLPSLVSALAGLALKAALTVVIVATVLLPSTLLHALCPPKRAAQLPEDREMQPMRSSGATPAATQRDAWARSDAAASARWASK